MGGVGTIVKSKRSGIVKMKKIMITVSLFAHSIMSHIVQTQIMHILYIILRHLPLPEWERANAYFHFNIGFWRSCKFAKYTCFWKDLWLKHKYYFLQHETLLLQSLHNNILMYLYNNFMFIADISGHPVSLAQFYWPNVLQFYLLWSKKEDRNNSKLVCKNFDAISRDSLAIAIITMTKYDSNLLCMYMHSLQLSLRNTFEFLYKSFT